MKIGRILILIALFTVVRPVVVWAQTAPVRPNFPSCEKPQGLIKVDYPTGAHGIPGNPNALNGSDTVFNLSEETLTQCFCSTNGQGIQTNWWKISSLTLEEVEILQGLGWIYVPNGADWGLQESPYMAFNSKYICREEEDDDDNDNDDDDDNDDDNEEEGDILGSSTYRFGEVLGLASTGNILQIMALGTGSIMSLAVALTLLRKKSK